MIEPNVGDTVRFLKDDVVFGIPAGTVGVIVTVGNWEYNVGLEFNHIGGYATRWVEHTDIELVSEVDYYTVSAGPKDWTFTDLSYAKGFAQAKSDHFHNVKLTTTETKEIDFR